jgi:aspartate aminotransferase
VRVYHLNIGQPDLETPAVMRRRLAEVPSVLAYTPSAGTPEALATLRDYYRGLGLDLSADQIIVTTGGSEGLLFAMMAAGGEGDDVLLVEPFYTNYQAFATMAGLRLVPLQTRGEDGFHLPPREAWERARTPRTRMVVLCNPNNPTGTVYSADELRVVAEFCREHGLFLAADEVYRELVFDGRKHVSALALAGFEENVVVVDSLSKRYSACGIRLGCLVTRNRDLYGAAHRMAQGRLSPPGLAQLVSLGASELPPEYAAGVVAEYQARRDILFQRLSEIPGVFLRKPEGAFYFVPRLPVQDAEDFTAWMLSDFSLEGATVMVSPASGFYATPGLGRDEVRIAYVLKKEDLEASVRILARGLAAYREARGLGPVVAATATSTSR